MPTYEYECQSCHERLEKTQSFSDPDLTTCPACGGALRKVFSAVGIVFKGSGFYKNDSRPTATKAKDGSASSTASKSDVPAPATAPAASGDKKESTSSDKSSDKSSGTASSTPATTSKD